MKILVIEDEKKLAEYLRRALTEHSYVVDVAMDGVSGLHLARESRAWMAFPSCTNCARPTACRC